MKFFYLTMLLGSSSKRAHAKELPINLVFVRNGISEGTVAMKKRAAHDPSFIDDITTREQNSKWRLTNLGKMQARAAGRWLQSNITNKFDAFITGEFVRSAETAGYLNLPNAKWTRSLYLRPRDFGSFPELSSNPATKEFQN